MRKLGRFIVFALIAIIALILIGKFIVNIFSTPEMTQNEQIMMSIKNTIKDEAASGDNMVKLVISLDEFSKDTLFEITYSEDDTLMLKDVTIIPIKASIGKYGIVLEYKENDTVKTDVFIPAKETMDFLIEQYNSLIK